MERPAEASQLPGSRRIHGPRHARSSCPGWGFRFGMIIGEPTGLGAAWWSSYGNALGIGLGSSVGGNGAGHCASFLPAAAGQVAHQ